MARIGFSPLVVSASGSVADTVFSRWKGRNYIRSRVTPSNPNTALQQNSRNSLLHCVARQKELTSDLKTRWNEYASPYQMSGANQFCNYNKKGMDIAKTPLPVITPPNTVVAGPTDMGAVTGAGSGEIAVTWSTGASGALIWIEAWVIKKGAAFYDTAMLVKSHAAVLASVHALTISGLTPGAAYNVMVCIYNANLTENKYSQGYSLAATAKA